MKTGTIVTLITAAALFLVLCIYGMSVSNREVSLRNTIKAKQRDNESQLANLKAKISQTVQVTDMQKQMLVDIVIGNAQARKGGSGTLATMVTEAVPNLEAASSTYKTLINIITGSRDAWTMRQTELLALKAAHDTLLDSVPSGWIVGGRGKIDVQIVTSTAAKAAMASGVDDDVKLK